MKPSPYLRRTRLGTFAAFVLLLVLIASGVPQSAAAAGTLPNSMASTGDSITRAFNTGSIAFLDAPANSWSTGTSSSVNSVYKRILALNPAISGRNYNDAKTGAKMRDLVGQVALVNSQHVEYVTILMGANDVCTSSEATMTSVQDFHDQFLAAMNSLNSGSPSTRIQVMSIPNIYNLWSILKGNPLALTIWTAGNICQSMLMNPISFSTTDAARRQRVQQRNIAFNSQLQQVCAQFPQCRFDNNAVYNTTFVSSEVSSRDYFHPSIAGQAKLAAVTWAASGFAP